MPFCTPNKGRSGRDLTARSVLICLLVLFSWVGLAASAHSAACDAIFTNGAQTHSAAGEIRLAYQAQILNGGTALVSPKVTDRSRWDSCGTAKCVASSSFADPVIVPISTSPPSDGNIKLGYQATASYPQGSYGTVSLAGESTLTFTTSGGTYYARGITTRYRSKIVFSSGDYYIDGDLFFDNEVQLQRSGTGTIRLFVNGSVEFDYLAGTSGIAPEDLLIYAKNDIIFDQDNVVSGYFYSEQGNVDIGYRATITGGVSAAQTVDVGQAAVINYQALSANNDFGAFCGEAVDALASFNIAVGAGSASTCSPASITISARDADDQILTSYIGTLNLGTSSGDGDWSLTGTAGDAFGLLTLGATDSGTASYTFDADGLDQGQVTLHLNNTHAQTLTITAADSAAGVSAVSASLTFAENAFVVAVTSSYAYDLIAGRGHPLAAYLMLKDPATGECGIAQHYNVADVKVWLTRDTSDPGADAPTLTNASGDVFSLPSAEPASANITLPFINGAANFSLLASDVGKYALNFQDGSLSFADTAIGGGSAAFVARPFGFAITVPGNPSPSATSADGGVFTKAGNDFSVTVSAVAWQAEDDTNNDGRPDGHDDIDPGNNANLVGNPVLAHFGQESPRESVTLSSALILPSGGADPGLGGSKNDKRVKLFENGTASTHSVHFSEVGIIEIAASITSENYLGQGVGNTQRTISKSPPVGRFTPAFFRVQNALITAACTQQLDFSYMSQPFAAEFDLRALNSLGLRTLNYQDSFAKLNGALGELTFRAIDQTAATPLTTRVVVPSPTIEWSAGSTNVHTQVSLQRGAAPEEPFELLAIGVHATDQDNVAVLPATLDLDTDNDATTDTVRLGTTEVRYGRLILMDSFGPETANVPVTFHTEIWRDGIWQINRDDDCTVVALTDIAYNNQPISVSTNRTVTIGGGTTTGEYPYIEPTAVGFRAGDADHYFTPPGAGNTGSLEVDVNLLNYLWLQFDWNDDGDHAEPALPTATFTFGSYRGHDRIIHWREVLQ